MTIGPVLSEGGDLIERFEAAWNAGCPVTIEEALAEAGIDPAAPGASIDILLELVSAEYSRRELAGELPAIAEYVERFPGLEEAIRKTLESSVHEQTPLYEVVRDAPTPLPAFQGYRTLGRLGQGGMGEVYRALQIQTGREVAIKVILRSVIDEGSGLEIERFRREAEANARLDHPNIVPIYEAGRSGTRLFLSMRLMPGGNLRDRLDEYRDRPRAAAELVATLADAVQHAHSRTILHRDIKPHNVLLDQHGQPYLADFGLARLLDYEVSLTESQEPIGSPPYMAPEQIVPGRYPLSVAVDVYGLGTILYSLLTGQRPFDADSREAYYQKVLPDEPTSPRSLRPSTPRDLESICLKRTCAGVTAVRRTWRMIFGGG